MIVALAPAAAEGYLKLAQAREEVSGVDELLDLFDRTLPRQLGDSAPDTFRLGRFQIHRLRGVLAGWWSADVGTLIDGRTMIAVFYSEGHKVSVAAIAEHDAAYRGAKFRRAELAPTSARRRAILKRIR